MTNHTTKYGYKGPIRDDQIAVRVSKATAEAFRKLCRARGKSQADVLIEWVQREQENAGAATRLDVWVFLDGDGPAVVMRASGDVELGWIDEIEAELADPESPVLDKGNGFYRLSAFYEQPQVDGFGRVELVGYWDLTVVGFDPLGYPE